MMVRQRRFYGKEVLEFNIFLNVDDPVTAARIEFDRDMGWAPRIHLEIEFSPVQVTGYAEVECKCGHCGEVVYASEAMAREMKVADGITKETT